MEENLKNRIRLILSTLSTKPGVYRYLDERGQVIYVGKAKNLKRRVSSYFNKNHDSPKVRMLVTKIRDIQTTVVDTEWEALLLENTLIKQYKPKYNILLKDDKTYPWISVTKEDFPKVFPTRSPNHAAEDTFGPYASVRYMTTLLDTVFKIFPVRECNVLHPGSRPCMMYQMKKCPAPCAGKISQEDYQKRIASIKEILKGNSNLIINQLYEEMMQYASEEKFEEAAEVKKKWEILKQFRGRSVVVNPEITRLDIFTIVEDEQNAYVNFMRVMEGAVVQSYTMEISNKLDKTKEELLLAGMLAIQDRFGKLNPQILLPFKPDIATEEHEFIVPQRGDKKKLLDLSLKNAFTYMTEKNRRRDMVNPERRSQRVLAQLQKDLGMSKLPSRIECFDNSNTQGCEPVSAMVCFIDGKPAKNEYRHFLVKTVVGADDFATMEEVIYRRYKRQLDEGNPLPDLIVIDGGKGQLNAAYRSLQNLELQDRIFMIGIAERLEDIFRVGDTVPLYIDKKSEAQLLLQRVRDAVHDFGIAHHRKRRAKKSIQSQLDGIPGIGPVLKTKLLQKFKSVKRIGEASEEDLAAVVGPAKAKIVHDFFRTENGERKTENGKLKIEN